MNSSCAETGKSRYKVVAAVDVQKKPDQTTVKPGMLKYISKYSGLLDEPDEVELFRLINDFYSREEMKMARSKLKYSNI